MAEKFSKGNEAFVEENYEEAEQHYTSAIEQDGDRDEYYVARAHARTQLENFKDAVSDGSKAIELNSKNIKAFLRKGVALFHLGEFDAAEKVFIQGKSLDDSDKHIATWLRKCEAELDLARKKLHGDSGDDKVLYGCSSVTSQTQDTAAQAVTNQTECPSQVSPTTNQADSPTRTDPPTIPMPTGPKTRYDWYQTETHVIISIMLKNVKKEDLETEIRERSFSASVKLPSGSDYCLQLDLSHNIGPDQSQVKILSTKIEVKLKKLEGFRWDKLEGEPEKPVKHFTQAAAGDDTKKYPSSSQHPRDWDKVVANINEDEKNEKLEGDAALNQLFQQIYSDGTDEVKKAMNKSFAESGGTVLSTNWGEIAEKNTDIKPPDGMEYKQYS